MSSTTFYVGIKITEKNLLHRNNYLVRISESNCRIFITHFNLLIILLLPFFYDIVEKREFSCALYYISFLFSFLSLTFLFVTAMWSCIDFKGAYKVKLYRFSLLRFVNLLLFSLVTKKIIILLSSTMS